MFIIIGIILIAIGLLGLFYCLLSDDSFKWLDVIFKILATIGIILLSLGIARLYSSPLAIDVYRGKTTLQITYEDSIPVDTVVVYKSEFRK